MFIKIQSVISQSEQRESERVQITLEVVEEFVHIYAIVTKSVIMNLNRKNCF